MYRINNMCKICKICKEEKPLADFGKLSQSKDGLNYHCKVCGRKKSKDWAEKNKEKLKDVKKKSNAKYLAKMTDNEEYKEKQRLRAKEYRIRNGDKIRARQAIRRKTHKEKIKGFAAKYRETHKEQIKAWHANHNKTHRAELNARLWKYRAAKRRALVKWADIKAIQVIYAKCHRLSKWLDLKHHVDHIVPLQSDFVCGLHCEANLRIISESDNISKGNRHWPDMW